MYVLKTDSSLFLDAREAGNLGSMCSHSCDPSCELKKVKLQSDDDVYVLVTKRVIQKGMVQKGLDIIYSSF